MTEAVGATSGSGLGVDAASLEALRRDYRAAFLRYLPRREEAALESGYRLGRDTVARGMSLLDLAQVHHDILVEVLSDSKADEHPSIASAASEFFLEVLATHDMTERVRRVDVTEERAGKTPRAGRVSS